MDPENIATENEELAISDENVEEIEATEVKEPEEEKEISIADAIKKAMETTGDPEPKKTALPAQDGIVERVKEDGKEIDPISGRVLEPIKPPGSLTPALREKWKDVDPRFQKFFTDREREIANTMNETVEARRIANSFKDIATPYESMLRKFGITAEQHTKELFNLSHGLNSGTPQERATIIYNLIQHFQPDAGTLEQLFNGQQPVQQVQQPAAVDVEAEVQRILAEREVETVNRQAENILTHFASKPGHEYFDDVKVTMGKIIDAGLVEGSGEQLLENAYELACSRHPEISQLNRYRAVQQPVRSVKPSLGAGRPQPKQQREMSISEAVAQAMREHGMN
jgi:hypothetical protein